MADQTPGEGNVDTPEQGTDNWQERYKEAQSWGTREAQARAQLEAQLAQYQDPDYQANLLREWGYEVAEDPESFEDTQPQQLDPDIAQRLAKVDELEQWRNQTTQEAQQEQRYASYREDVDPQLTQLGVPDALLEAVADIAYHDLPALQTPQGPAPDLQGAVDKLNEIAAQFADLPTVKDRVAQQWAQSKRAPHVSNGGQAATGQPKLDEMTPEQILQWQVQRLEELGQG